GRRRTLHHRNGRAGRPRRPHAARRARHGERAGARAVDHAAPPAGKLDRARPAGTGLHRLERSAGRRGRAPPGRGERRPLHVRARRPGLDRAPHRRDRRDRRRHRDGRRPGSAGAGV
ncbi:MAG: hypothetical protein AVDCRST_MAG85-1874, partial [uncultured Solirubrobacteraceae bacterium]